LKKIPEIVKIFANKSKAPKSISLKEEINNNVPSTCVEELGKIGELCISIYTDKKLSHMITLPEKNSQSPYTESEKNILYMLRPKIALSLQFLEYNKHLQEVDHQTKKISQQGKELEISYGKLEALDKEKDVFMNMAAHELRTPMTIIHGYADIMLDPMS
jgi:signal transduction histidine kinase